MSYKEITVEEWERRYNVKVDNSHIFDCKNPSDEVKSMSHRAYTPSDMLSDILFSGTYDEVSKTLGVSICTVQRMLDLNEVKTVTLWKMAKKLNVDPSQLIEGRL